MDTLTRRVEQVSGVKVRVASAMPASRSMALRNKLTKIVDHWPLAFIVFGGALTLVWVAVLIWLSLRLLQVV